MDFLFFCRKTILSHFMFYAIFNIKKNIEKCPFTYWLNGRWLLQIVERDSWNLYSLYPLFSCSDFVSQLGGGCNVFSHFMLFPTFLEKKIWEYKTIISHLMFSSCFFLYAGGGGGIFFFFRKTILSHFTFYAIFNIKKKKLKSPPSLTG